MGKVDLLQECAQDKAPETESQNLHFQEIKVTFLQRLPIIPLFAKQAFERGSRREEEGQVQARLQHNSFTKLVGRQGELSPSTVLKNTARRKPNTL